MKALGWQWVGTLKGFYERGIIMVMMMVVTISMLNRLYSCAHVELSLPASSDKTHQERIQNVTIARGSPERNLLSLNGQKTS